MSGSKADVVLPGKRSTPARYAAKLICPSSTISSNVSPDTWSSSVAPGPPRVTVAVNGVSVPAPSPVTVAVPSSTAVCPSIRAAVSEPVTYIAYTSKLPLPGLPASTLGTSARHSKPPWPARQEKPNFVITGVNEGAPVPALTSEVPAPRTAAGPSDFLGAACARIAQASRPATTVAVTSNSLLLVFLNIENPSQKPDVYGGRLGPERGRPAAGRPSLTDTRLPQPVEERDAVGLRIGVRRWGEGEAPEGQREPLEVAADRLGQVAVDAQNGVDALAWRGPIRDEAHVERDDPRGRLVLVLRRAGPVADPVDKACPREVTSLQWLPADEAGDDVGAL